MPDHPNLVLLHGYPFDHSLWTPVAQSLEDTAQVWAPDLPGFGGRKPLPCDPSLEALADWLARELQCRGLARVHLAGMSMGGYLALAFAERHAPRLAGLALVNSHVWVDPANAAQGRLQMAAKVLRDGPFAAVEGMSDKLLAPANRNNPALNRQPAIGAAQAGIDGIRWALQAMAARPDRSQVWSDLGASCPTALIAGTEDPLVPDDKIREMATLNPRAAITRIPGAGHCSPIETPAAVSEALKTFLKS